jgi:small conductance mechanosensitive channel
MPIDFSNAWNTGVKIINETISLLPNILLALLIFFAFLLLGAVGKSVGAALGTTAAQTSGNRLADGLTGSLQNFLAGILLRLQEPFQLGDFISVIGIEGTVYDLQSRATIVSTKDGRRVVIPNAVVFTSPVAVELSAARAT